MGIVYATIHSVSDRAAKATVTFETHNNFTVMTDSRWDALQRMEAQLTAEFAETETDPHMNGDLYVTCDCDELPRIVEFADRVKALLSE